jgi:hypothetical protein
MVGDALGIKLDEVRCDAEYAQTTEGVDLGSWTIPAGCVAGVYASLKGASSARRRSWRLPCASAWARPSVGLDDPAKWLGHRSSRPPDGNDERGLPSVLGLRGHHAGRVQGARPHHDRHTPLHDCRRRRRHRHLQRRAADPAARRRGTHLTGPTGTATMRLKATHTDSLVLKHCRHPAHIYRYLW